MTTNPTTAPSAKRQPISSRYICLTDRWGTHQWIDIDDKRTVLTLVDVIAHGDGPSDALDALRAHVDALHATLASTFDWALSLEAQATLQAGDQESFDDSGIPTWQLAMELEGSIECYQQAVDDLASVIAGLHSPEPTMKWPFEPDLLWRDATGEFQDLRLTGLNSTTIEELDLSSVLAFATCVLAQLRRAERQLRVVIDDAADTQLSGK